MPNGTGLISNYTAGQCGLIVPVPSSASKYVIFCNTEFSSPGNLNYSVVDMTLNSGLGNVISGQKNISLGTGWTEKLCAYYNCNGNYYWVLAHKWNTNTFVALKVDVNGVSSASVTTNIGSVHNCGTYSGAHDAMGQLTISKDGTKVINALTCQDKYELFDFNIATGVLSNPITIPGDGNKAWGTAFSADSKKLYVNSIFGGQIYQFDLTTNTSAAINASKYTVYNTSAGGYSFGYMELGPDNKLYISRPNVSYLSVVSNPNAQGSACNFIYGGVNLSPKTSSWGISRIAYNIPSAPNNGTYTVASNASNITCNGLSNGTASITTSSSGSYTYLWTPGNYTTSVVNGLAAGTYSVLVSDGGCNSATTTVNITEPPALTHQISSSEDTVCINTAVTLSATVGGGTPGYTVNWSTGASNSLSISITPTVSTVYQYTVTDAHLCTKTETINIRVEHPIADFSVASTPCSGTAGFQNLSSGSNSYSWTLGNGNISQQFSPAVQSYSANGTYTAALHTSSPKGCKDSIQKIFTVSLPVNLPLTTSTGTIGCFNGTTSSTVNVSIPGSYIYSWLPVAGTSSVATNLGAGTYSVYVSDMACGSGSAIVNVVSPSQLVSPVILSNDTICSAQFCTISTAPSGGTTPYSMSWSNGSVNVNQITVSPTNSTVYSFTLTDSNNCVNTQTVLVSVEQVTSNFSYSAFNCTSVASFTNTSSNSHLNTWYFGDGIISNSANGGSHTYPADGSYTVSLVSYSPHNCKDSLAVPITISNSTLTADFSYNPSDSKCSDTLYFHNLSSGASVYSWDFGDGQHSNLSDPVIIIAPGVYQVTLAVTSGTCSSNVEKQVSVDFATALSQDNVPNVFTPNLDGVNEVFDLNRISPCEDFEFYIFDRWGLLIQKGDSDKSGLWDGRTTSGNIVTDGTYFYLVKTESGTSYRGTVNVFR